MAPANEVLFRGFSPGDDRREWREVLYLEKLWQVKKLAGAGDKDLSRKIAEEIGIGRVTTQFRDQIAGMYDRAQDLAPLGAPPLP